MITSLRPDQVIIVGTNLLGRHAGGAARQAAEQFGLVEGVAEGLSGSTYAFPTLDENFQQVSNTQLKASRLKLYKTAEAHPELTFLLTKVGCGIASFDESKMKGLFRNAPANIVKPLEWQ